MRSNKVHRSTTGRVMRHFLAHKWTMAAYLTTLALSAGTAALVPLLTKALIDHGLVDGDPSAVLPYACALGGLSLVAAVAATLSNWLGSRVGLQVILDLRLALYRHLEKMPIAFFARSQAGALQSRINNDVMGAQSLVQGLFGSAVANSLVLVTTLAAMVYISPVIALLSLVVVPFFLWPVRVFGGRVHALARLQARSASDLQSYMNERLNVSGAILSKVFSRPDEDFERFRIRATSMRDIVMKRNTAFAQAGIFLAMLGVAGAIIVYLVGGRAVSKGSITVGGLVALIVLVQRVYEPLIAFATQGIDVHGGLVAFERVFELLDFESSIVDSPSATPLVGVKGEIEFRQVSFAHPRSTASTLSSLLAEDAVDEGGSLVLDDVSFRVPAGTTTAIVGPTGAGKTTLTHLIARLYDVTDGSVLIDGRDLREVTLNSLHAALGLVAQDTYLFNDTLENNLRFVRPMATEAELLQVCSQARLGALLAKLPQGLQTLMGDRGYRLSGGEKQRLALARVLLKQPAIVLLDEATAHLDAETEKAIQQALNEGLVGKTVVVVAHRLSTVRHADQILVLSDGCLVEQGDHETLMGAGGRYLQLYEAGLGA